MNVIIAFGRCERPRVKREGMQRTVLIRLTAYGSKSILGCIRFKEAGLRGIKVRKNWLGNKNLA
jgi:hypothetical protein